MTQRQFFKVYADEVEKLGTDAAVLLAKLRHISKKIKKDKDGYFTVPRSFLCEQIRLGRTRFERAREKLVECGYIDFIPGLNQNAKTRYKIVL